MTARSKINFYLYDKVKVTTRINETRLFLFQFFIYDEISLVSLLNSLIRVLLLILT